MLKIRFFAFSVLLLFPNFTNAENEVWKCMEYGIIGFTNESSDDGYERIVDTDPKPQKFEITPSDTFGGSLYIDAPARNNNLYICERDEINKIMHCEANSGDARDAMIFRINTESGHFTFANLGEYTESWNGYAGVLGDVNVGVGRCEF